MRDRAWEDSVRAEIAKLEALIEEHGQEKGVLMYFYGWTSEYIDELGGI